MQRVHFMKLVNMFSILLSSCVLLFGHSLGVNEAVSDCPKQPADILFLVDGYDHDNYSIYNYSSDSEFFNKSYQLIRTYINFLEIGIENVKVSVFNMLWWPWEYWEIWYCGFFLNTYSNKSSIQAVMDNNFFNSYTKWQLEWLLQNYYCNGPLTPFQIFDFVTNVTFDYKIGARDNAYKIIIVLTHFQHLYNTSKWTLLKNRGVKIFAIGFGAGVDVSYLKKIATDETYVYRVMTYDVLNTITELLINKSCTVITRNACEDDPCKNNGSCVWTGGVSYQCLCVPGFTDEQCQTDINECENVTCLHGGTCIDGTNKFTCNCPRFYSGRICETDLCDYLPADILFILDGSYSMDATCFDQQKLIIENILQNFTLSEDEFQIGIITYSSDSKIIFNLNQFSNTSLVQVALENIKFQNRTSLLFKGLQDANSIFNNKSYVNKRHPTRGEPKKFVVILFDGLTSDHGKTLQEARKLRQRGVQILAVAVGEDFYHQRALDIVGGKRKNIFINQDSKRLYNRIMYELSDPGCFDCKVLNKTDMVFLVDVSSNMKNVHLMNIIPTLHRNITGSFPIGITQKGVRYSLITFHSEAKVEFNFTKFDGNMHAMISSYVGHLEKMSGKANITAGLKEAVNMFQNFQANDRKKQLVIISPFLTCIDKFAGSVLKTLKQTTEAEVIIIALDCDDKRRKAINNMATSAAHTFYICNHFKDNIEPLLANMQDIWCKRQES